ncbi:Isochorismatase hydrolase [Lojkania enalia]|uniref:Isochorismatase hydrolase n=1 Tax=Lojkania enalia TaxID=147567 RepID=A0A9P4NBD3_9PLEO|nr:Isochorismatase hydrolase [Didymosphaeria enalia]
MEAMFNTADISAPGYYRPSQTALLLLDFHTIFIEQIGGPEAPAAMQVAAKLKRWAKLQGIQIIHCLIDPKDTPSPTCKGAKRFTGLLSSLRTSGGEEPAELLEDIREEVTFTRKPGHVSALRSPGLEVFLQKKGIRSLILTGLSTSGCVMRTANMATDFDYVVTVISDGCADRTGDIHDLVMEKVCSNRGYVITSAEFQEGFERSVGRK